MTKTYFEEPLHIAYVSDSLCRLSIRSSENRVDEYLLLAPVVEHLIKNATSSVWETMGDLSVKQVGDSVYIRILSGVSSTVYLVPLSAVQTMSGKYLDVTRNG